MRARGRNLRDAAGQEAGQAPAAAAAELDVAGGGHAWSVWPRSASAAFCISPSSRHPRRRLRRPRATPATPGAAGVPTPVATATPAPPAPRRTDGRGRRRRHPSAAADRLRREVCGRVGAVRQRSDPCARWQTTMRRPAISRRSRSTPADSTASSPGSRAKKPQKPRALEQCQKRADAAAVAAQMRALRRRQHGRLSRTASRRCRRCPGSGTTQSTERPFVAERRAADARPGQGRLETAYVPARKTKAIALGPGGGQYFMTPVRTRSRKRRAGAWSPAARLPAFPA